MRARRRPQALGAAPLLALVFVAISAAACAATPDSASGIESWIHQAQYRSTVSLLRTDVAEIGRGIAAHKLLATRTACDGLGSDAASAIGVLPTPDHRLTEELNAAYKDLVNGAQECSLAASFTAPGFARYESAKTRALAGLRRADARIRHLEGR